MKGAQSQSRPDAKPGRLSRQRRLLSLFVWVVGICLSFGAYTLLANALTHGVASEAYAPRRSLATLDQEAVMKIDPATTVVEPGATFSVTVAIEDASDLGGFEFELTYDSTCVTATAVTLGPFLGSTGRSVAGVGPTFDTGTVTYGAYSWGANPGPDGDGVLATVHFQAGPHGCDSVLHLQNVSLLDTLADPLPVSTADGEVRVAVPPEVTSITPDWGYVGDVLEDVIVRGNSFQPGASVELTRTGQSISAPLPDVQSSTRISCTFNLGKAATGRWTVKVTNPDGQSGELPDGFTVKAVTPTVTSINPSWGYAGQVVADVIVVGEDFQSGASVQLTKGGQTPISASPLDVQSPTRIRCTLDLGEAVTGKWTVKVTNPGGWFGELPDGFAVKAAIYLPIVLKNR